MPSSRSLVASGHAEVTAAARVVLEAGGNAFDAAAAAGFASTVAEPMLASLGGGGFLLARTVDGEEDLFDFFVDTPGRGRDPDATPDFEPISVRFSNAVQEFHVGLGAAAVPGCLAGFLHVHERLGTLPLADVVAPAIRLARDGVPLSPFQAHVLDLLRPIVRLGPQMRELFAPGGNDLGAGDRFVNPALASFLEGLPYSADAFYTGSIGADLVERMDAAGGLLSTEDLAAYRVIERRPLAFEYHGTRLLTNPTPSVGGELIAHGLEHLEGVDLGAPGSARHLAGIVGAMEAQVRRRAESARGGPTFPRGTTHISVIDGDGNAASLTLSNGEGSGYVVPGTGVILNNMLGEDDLHPEGFHRDPPGIRIGSMMAPTLGVADGRVRLALGSGGSKRIRTALLQVLVARLHYGLPLRDAIEAPRLHLDERLEIEPGHTRDAVSALAAHDPNVWRARSMYFGGVHAVATPDEAVGDARREGSAWVEGRS